ncbi:MAG: TolC family protein [Planctomycetes bacterium]|nr:TolC family protein [Planctomycetota bacterium]
MSLRQLLIFVLAAAWLVTGCSSVREARKAQDTDNIPAGERTVTASEIGLTKDSVLTLDKSLEIALQYHPSMVQSRQSLISSEKQYGDAIAGYLPTVSANASVSKSTSNTSTKTADNTLGDSSYSTGVSLSQLIYDFGETPANIRQAYENKLTAESSLKAAENSLAYNVKQAYYDLSKQQALLKVAEETVKQYEIHLEQTKIQVEVGGKIKYDITKAEVDLSNARISLVNSRNDLRTARAVLNNTLGLAEDPEYTIEESKPAEMKDYSFESLLKTAKEQQPEFLAQQSRERAASASVDKAIANLFPSLSLSGSYRWSGSEFPLVWNWSLSSSLGLNLFNGFQNTSQIDQAVANLRSTRAAKASLEQKIYLDLTRAVAQLESAQERLTLADLTVKQAAETLNLITERYKIGKASAVEVTDAQVSLTKAQVDKIQAQFDYQTAIALIKSTIGEK